MPVSGASNIDARTTDQTTDQPIEVVELHWMKESDLAMHADAGVAVPALCGAWVDPDPPLTARAQAGGVGARYVSCTQCDLLASLRTTAMTA